MTWATKKRFSTHLTYTAAETGVALYTPDPANLVCVDSITIVPKGATSGTVTVWFGAAADTTYSQGTDQPCIAGALTPSAADTAFTGAEQLHAEDVVALSYGHLLRLTTVGNIDLDITIHGREVR